DAAARLAGVDDPCPEVVPLVQHVVDLDAARREAEEGDPGPVGPGLAAGGVDQGGDRVAGLAKGARPAVQALLAGRVGPAAGDDEEPRVDQVAGPGQVGQRETAAAVQ